MGWQKGLPQVRRYPRAYGVTFHPFLTVKCLQFSGQYKEIAQREPISVTSNGRESVVLLSAAEYKEYEALKQSRYAYQGKVSDDFKGDVASFEDAHHEVLDGLAK